MLEIKDLDKWYGSKHALDKISLTFGPGEIVGLFGENGAGKTTLMKCILGFLRYNGSVRLDGEQISRKNIVRLSFATCEHSFFPDITPKAHAEFFAEHFELSGSNIKEILTNAAYLAAAEGTGLRNSHIVEAVKLNFSKYGKILDDSQFGYLVV